MIKYADVQVTFAEIPNEISLCINISGCRNGCGECHSPHLHEDIGEVLNDVTLSKLIDSNTGITCVCFMGGDHDPLEIKYLASHVKSNFPNLLVGWYSGRDTIPPYILCGLNYFNYIKVGPFKKECGPINCPTTNQIMYEVQKTRELDEEGNHIYKLINITSKFWNNHEN